MNKALVNASRKPHFQSDGVRHATINNHRFHLRIARGHSHLWIDGRQPPLILDQTAADFIAHLIDGMWLYSMGDGDESQQITDYVVDKMYRKYGRWHRKVTRERIREDLDRIVGTVMGVADMGCPLEMGLESQEIAYDKWTAPARMDLAITYRCNLRCGKCYLPGCELGDELTLDQWLKIFKILWKVGVPLVVFTGGEPTLREDLIDLVSEAEEFVTGLVTNGTRLVELAEPLRSASLDYVQVTIESSDPAVHDSMTEVTGSHAQTVAGIRKALETGLEVVTNTTLTKANGIDFVRTLNWLHNELGVSHVACNTLICSGKGTDYRREHGLSDAELRPVLEDVCKAASDLGVDLQWYSPTCYNTGINPMELGLGIKTCSAAAHNMTIQPDGTVLPCQSWPDSVGNIIKNRWKKIWQHPTCVKLRGHKMAASECSGCSFMNTCGGSCPLDDSPRQCSSDSEEVQDQ